MHPFLEKIEEAVDHSIPIALIALLAVLIVGLFFADIAEAHAFELEATDTFIVFIFVVDLLFKYYRVNDPVRFVIKYWPDILAVFPFYLAFRVTEALVEIVRFEEYFGRAQKTVHELLELERLGVRLAREIESGSKLTRAESLARFIRPLFRSPQLLKIANFFEAPKTHRKKALKAAAS